LDAASDHKAILEIQGKTPKTQVGYKYLPQGCSAKREIILDDRTHVQNFLFRLVKSKKSPNLSLFVTRDKSAAHLLEVVRAAPMLKNNSAESSLFW
jgi:hypothetical protein